MNSIQAINIVRDNLRNNLSDPYVTAGGASRTWIYSDEPLSGAKYPMLQLKKLDNPTEVISIGSNYYEFEQIFINLWFYSKNGFKITVGGTEYANAQLVEYYQGLIKTTLKAQFNTLFTAGVKGYKHINTTTVEYDPETQLYFGACTIRVFYFNQ